MKRREFIKSSCISCASLVGVSALTSILNSCASLPVLKINSSEKMVAVPLSSFIENQNLLIVKNPQLEFDILVIKKKDNTYNALYMQCSHQSQPLTANKSGLFCASHGSSFDLEGNVTLQPATQPLKKFKTEIENTNLNIYLN